MRGHVTSSANDQLYTIKINKDFLMRLLKRSVYNLVLFMLALFFSHHLFFYSRHAFYSPNIISWKCSPGMRIVPGEHSSIFRTTGIPTKDARPLKYSSINSFIFLLNRHRVNIFFIFFHFQKRASFMGNPLYILYALYCTK